MSLPRCGCVSVLGLANAGKSTLINRMIGEKVSIVSPKPHTTRTSIFGILTEGDYQAVFIDTPGLVLSPTSLLQRAMTKSLWGSTNEANVCLFIIDAVRKRSTEGDTFLSRIVERGRPVSLVLNKVDLIDKERLLPIASAYMEMFPMLENIFMVSGTKGSGVAHLKRAVLGMLPERVWLFPEDMVSTLSERAWAEEVTREKVFQNLHQEIPYKVHVQTDRWYMPGDAVPEGETLPKTGITIFQTIFVEKESHRKLVLGHGGQRIKHIGQEARRELCQTLDTLVHLFLYVKILSDKDRDTLVPPA